MRRRALLLAAALAAAACAAPATVPPAHDGPIVLVTFDALRADVVGALGGPPGLTPHLDRLAARSDWAGRGIAASSWGVPALASLATGLQPWQHGALHAGRAGLHPDLTTLAEALARAGWRTLAFPSGHWFSPRFGYEQGFDRMRELGLGHKAEARLARLSGRELVWLHVPEPEAPYRRHDGLLARVPDAPPGLPSRVGAVRLEQWFDPQRPLPEAERQLLWSMYRLNVAWADLRLGRLLAAIRRSGQWDRTLLVVTATYGEAFGEHGQAGHGGSLAREQIEVPLLVKLPRGFARRLAPPPSRPVATARLWATLVEAAGGRALPAAAPSLFRAAPDGALSELYLANGTNELSLVAGEYQLRWRSRFAPPEPAYFTARLASLAGRGGGGEAQRLFHRLRTAFEATPPLGPGGAPELVLERWEG
ncbi:MAG TPA: sulfatase-like hydrolase/transferase, partial [Thermoanaerobaculia bacterium]|nr:sulfatase-like hydrolase/transferase [Thermoanaerobaculia bacterium]